MTRRNRAWRLKRIATVAITAALVVGLAPVTASAQTIPGADNTPPDLEDPRYELAPGNIGNGSPYAGSGSVDIDPDDLAETAEFGIEHLALTNKPVYPAASGAFNYSNINSDLAFQGDYAFSGNYLGFGIYDISDPESPQLATTVQCRGGQGDLTVYGDLVFMSVESTAGRIDCGAQGADAETRFRGVRIFDIGEFLETGDGSTIEQVATVQSCRGSHTHTVVEDPSDPDTVYVYISGTAGVRAGAELAGCANPAIGSETFNEQSARFRIDVIEVPLDAPEDAAIIGGPRLFETGEGEDYTIHGLWNGGNHGPGTQSTAQTDACHDITAYPEIGLAAGACEGNGLLIDISDPADPTRIDAVIDPNFSYWHSATFNDAGDKVVFTDEWGGGTGARCRTTDPANWGANSIFDIVEDEDGNKSLEWASHYKVPNVQATNETCVAHNGSLIPIPGRDVMVQAWYEGGLSVFDFTDSANPFEIAYFDRGPYHPEVFHQGGYWSVYWHDGYLYGNEIFLGFDSWKLTPTEFLSEAEIAATEAVVQGETNPQLQQSINYVPDTSFELVASECVADRDGMVTLELELTNVGSAASEVELRFFDGLQRVETFEVPFLGSTGAEVDVRSATPVTLIIDGTSNSVTNDLDCWDDPRVGLGGGWTDAEEASWNLDLLSSQWKPEGFYNPSNLGSLSFANSDLAFTDTHAFVGNFHGFNIYDLDDPTEPELVTSVVCPGGQGDVSIYGDLLFMSVEEARGRIDCGTQGNEAGAQADRFRGVRIFDVSDISNPVQLEGLQACKGSHTHTVVTDPDDDEHVYIYISGTSGMRNAAEAPGGCVASSSLTDPNTDHFSINVYKVPLDDPDSAELVNRNARVFSTCGDNSCEDQYADGALNGLPGSGLQPRYDADDPRQPGGQSRSQTFQCHDITAYPELGLAAGACQGHGILLDITDPANPKRIDEVEDYNFAYWHSATFSDDGSTVIFTDEWGGGTGARCRPTDNISWGANAIFDIVQTDDGPKMEWASYYKLPVPQTNQENCVAHNGNLLPVPGRDIMVQAWYQGGTSVFDFTDSANPYEIAFFDRGPNTASLATGGHWSSYYHNGYVYGSEIGRGLDVLELTASEHLSQDELDAAASVFYLHNNPQHQRSFASQDVVDITPVFAGERCDGQGTYAVDLTLENLGMRAGTVTVSYFGDGQPQTLTVEVAGLATEVVTLTGVRSQTNVTATVDGEVTTHEGATNCWTDPRYGLGSDETAQSGVRLVDSVDKPEGFSNPANLGDLAFANSDIAFSETHAFVGSFHGFNIYDIRDPENLDHVTSVVCPGGQGDMSLHGDLLFMSVEQTRGREDCSNGGDGVAFRGVRIFDVSDIEAPVQIAAVQACRGSHTHSLVTDPDVDDTVWVYIQGTNAVRNDSDQIEGLDCEVGPLTEQGGASNNPDDFDGSTVTDRFQVEIVRVPLAAPQDAAIVKEARLFSADPLRPSTSSPHGLWAGGNHGPGTQSTSTTDACHDITSYPAIGLAAGACEGNGILIDISNPEDPRRIDAVIDPNFAYWHSATFSDDGSTVIFTDEWGGGTGARCRATDRETWGANAIFDIVVDPDGNRSMELASYYKLPVVQTAQENCVAHNGNIIPVPGRDIMAQAWYQGGLSVFDFTDSANPYEIAFFDYGPFNPATLLTSGYWSTYYHDGYIYGSEIGRGFDVLQLTETALLRQPEIDAAASVFFGDNNPQHQQPFSGLGTAPIPTADAGGPYTAEVGETVTLDASGSTIPAGRTAVYTWTVGEDTYEGETVEVDFDAAGSYTVELEVADSSGLPALVDTDTASITVTATDDGSDDGTDDGSDDGTDDGSDDGTDDGSDDGTDDGSDDGTDDGSDDGGDTPPTVPACNAGSSFRDVSGGPHAGNVGCVAEYGITLGTSDGTFSPDRSVRRDQMASFLYRLLQVAGVELPSSAPNAWSDDNGSVHEHAINVLTELGIVQGTNAGGFNPGGFVSRDQMASFLVRTLSAITGDTYRASSSPFTDTRGSVHAGNIDVAYDLGIAQGRTATTFDPRRDVRRDQMASFLARTMQHLARSGVELTPID